MKIKMTEKHKVMAYILNKEMGYTMSSIAELMKVSQSTISIAIKEVKYRLQIQNLERELIEARRSLQTLGYKEEQIIPPNYNIN